MMDEIWHRFPVARYLLAAILGLVLFAAQPTLAQDDAAAEGEAELAAGAADDGDVGEEEAEAEEESEAEDLYSAEELDDLVAPYALYPDSLLAQVFMASTFPLEIVKADRWVEDNAELPEEQRADAAEAEDWDPSVQVLAAGFPTVVDAMAADLDGTEDLGNALLAQSDDVLDAVQRQRARAAAVGNLQSNEAQTVEVEDDTISIAPADPQVVYVPTYDTAQVYTTPPPAQPVVVETSDSGASTGALITTGLLSFGAGMLVNEIFDDDDDWDDYWRGPPRVDWDDGYVYPRPGVNVEGDVNIDVDRDRVDIDRDGAWRPARERRDEARDKIRERKGTGDGKLAAARDRPKAGTRDASRAKLDRELKARSGDKAAKLGKPAAKRKPVAKSQTREASSALKGTRKANLTDTKRASQRGKLSKAKSQKKVSALQRPSGGNKLTKPSSAKRAISKKPQRSSALNKRGGGKAKAHKARGANSRKGKRR